MKVTVRLVAALWLAALAVLGGSTYFQVTEERGRLTQDLERRAVLLGEGLKEAVEPAAAKGSRVVIDRLLKKFGRPDQGIAVYDRVASLVTATPEMALVLPASLPEATEAITSGAVQKGLRSLNTTQVYVHARPLLHHDKLSGASPCSSTIRPPSGRVGALGLHHPLPRARAALSLIAWLVVRMSVTRPMARMAGWTRALRRGQTIAPLEMSDLGLFGPMAREVTVLAKSLHRAQAAAEEEATLRLSGETQWTEERLKQFAKLRLGEAPLVVVSNREPVRHVRRNGKIVAETPASGLVTAMDPVMRACGGVWVAQGSGDADRESADERGRLRVPWTIRATPCAGCTSRRRRRRATTEAFPTRGSGRSATSCTRARSSALTTGITTGR